MGLSDDELRNHCKTILESARIKSKVVILCEGKIDFIGKGMSPQSYRKMEQMPDSNFYKACISKDWWRGKPLPQFFNCGDRNDVIDTYYRLLDMHESGEHDSYLEKEKLFAFIDVDLQPTNLSEELTVDDVFNSIYSGKYVRDCKLSSQRIFVTGLIHKEAYFLIPELQDIYSERKSMYQGFDLNLDEIYLDMGKGIVDDLDLQSNFKRVLSRIDFCQEVEKTNMGDFSSSWIEKFTANTSRKEDLVFTILMLRKAKEYFNLICPCDDLWTHHSPERFREQLSLEIANFYSSNAEKKEYHIPFIIKSLYAYA